MTTIIKHKKAPLPSPSEAIRMIARDKRGALAPRSPESDRKRSTQLEEAFLDGLRGGWSVSKSAWAAGVHERTVRRWKAASIASKRPDGSFLDDFAERWEASYEAGVDKLEDAAIRRAVEGVERPIYQSGVLVGSVTEYSDTLLSLILRGKRPEVYNARRHDRTGNGSGAISTSLEIEFVEPEGGS